MADDKRPLIIPRPVELAGMRARLLRAQQQQKDVTATGKRYDAVMDGIDEAHGAIKSHVGDLSLIESSLRATIESMLDRSNGGDPLDGLSDTSKKPAPGIDDAALRDLPKSGQTEPEHLTVNGVSTQQ